MPCMRSRFVGPREVFTTLHECIRVSSQSPRRSCSGWIATKPKPSPSYDPPRTWPLTSVPVWLPVWHVWPFRSSWDCWLLDCGGKDYWHSAFSLTAYKRTTKRKSHKRPASKFRVSEDLDERTRSAAVADAKVEQRRLKFGTTRLRPRECSSLKFLFFRQLR